MFDLGAVNSDVAVNAVGRPREIRTGGRRHAITGLESVRDETAAYPAGSGPRTVFVVTTTAGRFRLTHWLRDRRWTVEELAAGSGLARAA